MVWRDESAPEAWLGPCWSPPEGDTTGHSLVCRVPLPGGTGRGQTEGHSHRDPRRKLAPLPPEEALAPGSHPPRQKGEKLNQLQSEADYQ